MFSCDFRYFLAEIEGPEQKSDSEAEKGLQMLLDSDLPALKVIFMSYRTPNGALSIALESRHLGLSRNI